MINVALAETYRDLQRLDRAGTPARLEAELSRVLQSVGVEQFVAAIVPSVKRPPHERKDNFLVMKWPREWLDFYMKNNYTYMDPVYRGAGGAVRWRDAYGSGCDKATMRILEGARACNLRDGLTFAFSTADAATAIVSLAGSSKLDCSEQDEGRLALIAQFAVGKSICLKAGPDAQEAAPSLTRRERDVLMWTCEGKTDWEVGRILGISEHCADKYIRALKDKLKATSKTQLVARAFRLGLV